MSEHTKQLKRMGACSEAIEYARGFTTLQDAWHCCNRPDWMFWLIGRTDKSSAWSDDRKPMVLCALECAETVRHLWSGRDKQQIEKAIGILKEWCNGGSVDTVKAKASRTKLYAVADAADAAADAAAVAAVAAAADAAAVAAAVAAADAAAVAAAVAFVADADTDVAAAYAASVPTGAYTGKQYADIVRKHFPNAPSLN